MEENKPKMFLNKYIPMGENILAKSFFNQRLLKDGKKRPCSIVEIIAIGENSTLNIKQGDKYFLSALVRPVEIGEVEDGFIVIVKPYDLLAKVNNECENPLFTLPMPECENPFIEEPKPAIANEVAKMVNKYMPKAKKKSK